MRFRIAAAALACCLVVPACALRRSLYDIPSASGDFLARVWDAEFSESTLSTPSPFIDHAEVERRAKSLPSDLFTVREAGKSFEGRSIYHVAAGRGPVQVLLWSQMHGDEPTATAALFDVFGYLQRHRGEFVADQILSRLTLHAVPMLNPDGAERFQRRNAQGIDINRDALNLVTPEARLLKRLRDDLKPKVGFNLHNQSWRTGIGTPMRPATISLLSVAYDEARTVNEGRLLTKKLAAVVRRALEPIIGDRIGKYDDSFEVRAFGDNITLWGTPVLLIETGPYPEPEPDKYLVRANFIAIIAALESLATGGVHDADPRRYDSLPVNDSGLAHTVIRGGSVLRGDGTPPFRADVSLVVQRRVRFNQGRRNVVISTNVDDLGDLRTTPAMFVVEAAGWVLAPVTTPPPIKGQEVSLPGWTAAEPAPGLLQPGSSSGVMVLRPLGGDRYRVEYVAYGEIIIDRTS